MKDLDLSVFFTRDREEEGVWTDLYAGAEKTGVKIKIMGLNSSAGLASQVEYSRSLENVKAMKDPVEKAKLMNKAYVEHASNLVTGLESCDGRKLVIGNKEFVFNKETVRTILENRREFADFVINFSGKDKNFTKRNGD